LNELTETDGTVCAVDAATGAEIGSISEIPVDMEIQHEF
jgi:hypothetical protein